MTPTEKRFAKYHNAGADDACWLWLGPCVTAGYGQLYHKGENLYAHRYALAIKLGRPLETGEQALHRCDAPGCVNPAHLFVGTNTDNYKDRVAKGRTNAILTAADVRAIRRDYTPRKVTLKMLGEQYGVGLHAIRLVVKRTTWKHVS